MVKMTSFVALALVLFAGSCYGAERIVGGNPTTIDHYPSLVQVEFRNILTGVWSQSCAANILNEFFVLSAAHCFAGWDYHPFRRRIRAGTTYRNTGGVITYVLREHNHPSYAVATPHDGDITVVRLTDFMSFTPVIRQGLYYTNFRVPESAPVLHAGWGAVGYRGPASPILLDVQIYTINRELCRQRYLTKRPPLVITENMICAGLLDVGGRDACQGDSGGPLYYGPNNAIVGIISWGHECANETFPGVSAAVSPYSDWIMTIVESY